MHKFVNMPVFLTALSTIPGVILFFRFGWEVWNPGFFGGIGIIFLNHVVTIPNAFAVIEIPTNQQVQGGGANKPWNISMVPFETENRKNEIMKHSADADLIVMGFIPEKPKNKEELSEGYQYLANILFVSSNLAKAIN